MTVSVAPEVRLEILAEAVLKIRENTNWKRARTIEEVPDTCGHYAIYDGVEVRGGGVNRSMRSGLRNMSWYGRCEFQILLFLPDADGSAALWLEGKIRCTRCGGNIHDIELHDVDEVED